MKEYFILDLRHRGDNFLWWRPNNSGYTVSLAHAGRYTEEQVQNHLSYYSNNDLTLAIPCELALKLAVPIVHSDLGHFDQMKIEGLKARNRMKRATKRCEMQEMLQAAAREALGG